MADPMLSDADIDKMRTPLWEHARAAFQDGRSDDGSALLDKAVDQWGKKRGRRFMRDERPVYCAHCWVKNEMQRGEWGGARTSMDPPPERRGEPCVHHIYKDASAIPDDAYRRIGETRPSSE